MKLTWAPKYPGESEPRGVDFTGRLNGSTISSCNAELVRGTVIVGTATFDGSIVSVPVSGGSAAPAIFNQPATLDEVLVTAILSNGDTIQEVAQIEILRP